MQVQQEFISVGVNRVVNALEWGQDNCVAYGAHHMVALYDIQDAQVTATLLGHTNLVTCVSWIPSSVAPQLPAGTQLLVSGSADHDVIVWAVHQGGRAAVPWEKLAVLKGHSGPVTGVTFQPLPASSSSPAGSFLMVSTAGDTELRVWQCSSGNSNYGQDSWSCIQTLPVGTQMQQAVELTTLPGLPDWLLLVTGGTDARLHLYVRPPAGSFQPALKLSGHEGWVRSLAAHHVTTSAAGHTELLVASASQDRYGRVWKICVDTGKQQGGGQPGDELSLIMQYAPQPTFEAGGLKFSATLEALLIGHEDWVHSVRWQPAIKPGPAATTSSAAAAVDRADLVLLSASMDRTMMLWTYEANSALWMSVSSVGDAGATCLGYFTGVFSPAGTSILAHGFTGAMHVWDMQLEQGKSLDSCRPSQLIQQCKWVPRHALGGHWDAVAEVAWGMGDTCVISVSEDQTSRVFTATQWSGVTRDPEAAGHWCEIARPQVHGHDFSCLSVLPQGTQAASYAYVSGSEEKVLRVMEGTQAFLDTLRLLTGGQLPQESGAAAGEGDMRARAFGASVSALGLTNRMVLEEGGQVNAAKESGGLVGAGAYDEGPDFVPNAAPSVVGTPPLEEHLAQNTLWPEAYKLYGHGDSLYCCTASPDGRYLASGCVAKTEQQAAVWVWDLGGGTFKGVAQLQGHTLTVTQLAWSHNSEMLAACSRDRTFTIYKRGGPDAPPHSFSLIHRQKAAHTRILWGISWSHDDALLATGARDNLVKVWGVRTLGEGGVAVVTQPLVVLPAFKSAVTAVAFAPCLVSHQQGSYLLAVGLEAGELQLWKVCVGQGEQPAAAECVWQSTCFNTCAAQVNSLCWSKAGAQQQGGARKLRLACASQDHSVRVLRVSLQG